MQFAAMQGIMIVAACFAGSGVDPGAQEMLRMPFLHPTEVPQSLYSSSCELLLAVIQHHPSVQGILLPLRKQQVKTGQTV